MKAKKEQENDVYLDPILIEEGFFDDKEDYIRTMDEIAETLRKAADQLARERKKQSAKRKAEDTKV
jgi:hypothetical protein